jgi:hypothetical protein
MYDTYFGNVIYAYTRAQAIADGILVDLSARYPDEVRQLYKFPVAVTATVWGIIEAGVAAGVGNDYAGVVWDLLFMSQKGISRRISPAEHLFDVIITGAGPDKYFTFRAICGPGDGAESVVTIMLPNED